jgi:hypothetical protein
VAAGFREPVEPRPRRAAKPLHHSWADVPTRKANGAGVAFGLTCPCKPDMQCCQRKK